MRSSAVGEDNEEMSSAGQLKTSLGVAKFDDVRLKNNSAVFILNKRPIRKIPMPVVQTDFVKW